MAMKETRILAKMASDLKYEEIPEEALLKAKYLILDQIGCQVGFATLPTSKGMYQYTCALGSTGNSTLAYYGKKVNALDAEWCNAVFGHGFELDDIDIATATHPGVTIVPPTIALAEQYAKSGKEALTALVAGYETFLRVGRAGASMIYRGWDTTAVSGAFGAAAVAGRLMDVDEETMFHAISIATTEASSNAEYVHTGGSVKRTWGALGAYAGMRSTLLAKYGLTGPEEALEGDGGFLKMICETAPEPEWLVLPYSERFLILGVGHKPYSCCAGQHTVIDASEKIRAKGIDTKDIVGLEIMQGERDFLACGSMRRANSVVEAQFCGRFACALRLVKGANGATEYVEESVADPEIRRLVELAEYVADTKREYLPAECFAPARVTVTMKDGTVYQEMVGYAKGLPENPLTHEEAIAKFKTQTKAAISEAAQDKIIDYVMNMEEMPDLTPLISQMCG